MIYTSNFPESLAALPSTILSARSGDSLIKTVLPFALKSPSRYYCCIFSASGEAQVIILKASLARIRGSLLSD
jgi:hypothetical protein